MGDFYRQKECGTRKLLAGENNHFRVNNHLLLGGGGLGGLQRSYFADYLTGANQEISDCLFKGHISGRG